MKRSLPKVNTLEGRDWICPEAARLAPRNASVLIRVGEHMQGVSLHGGLPYYKAAYVVGSESDRNWLRNNSSYSDVVLSAK